MGVNIGGLKGRFRRLAVPLFEEEIKGSGKAALARLRGLDPRLRSLIARALDEKAFKAKDGEILLLFPAAHAGVGALALFGLGSEKKEKLETLRRAAGLLARRFAREGGGPVGLWLGGDFLRKRIRAHGWEQAAQALAEGWLIGAYVYDTYKSAKPETKKPSSLTLIAGALGAKEGAQARAGVARGEVIGDALAFARDLSNAPASELYPETLAARAAAMARKAKLEVEVLGKRDLVRLKMGALLGVSQGSERPPQLIVVKYQPRRKARKTLVLVGKSITFDSGGLSIKPAKGMEEMKFDMSGGAAVLGAMMAIARLKPPVRVIGILPASENMISGAALRPGDILRAASGKTIEIINTDAEGRLVLADALHYGLRFKPDYLVDLATLTGACLVALGTQVSGMVTNDKDFGRVVFEVGERTGERLWELPLYDEFVEATKSQVADIKNSAGRNAGAITAAAFLSHFVEKIPWCHLDIAGTAWSERDMGYYAAGATGVGVRLLVELVSSVGQGS